MSKEQESGITVLPDSDGDGHKDLEFVPLDQVFEENSPSFPFEPEEDDVDIKNLVNLFFREGTNHRLLTFEEEKDLALKIEKGKLATILLLPFRAQNGNLPISPLLAKKLEETVQKGQQVLFEERRKPKLSPKQQEAIIQSVKKENLVQQLENGIENLEAGLVAFYEFVEHNIKLIVPYAKEAFRKHGSSINSILDLIQEGYSGLHKGAQKFNWRRGLRFSTPTTYWIRQIIGRRLAETKNTIRIPVNLQLDLRRIINTKERLTRELGRKPIAEEIASEVNLTTIETPTPKKIKELLQIRQVLSLDQHIAKNEDSETLGYFQADAVDTEEEALGFAREKARETVRRAVFSSLLSEREQKVLSLRFGLKDGQTRTLEETGREFDLSGERIRQIETKALKKLRRQPEIQEIKDFVIV